MKKNKKIVLFIIITIFGCIILYTQYMKKMNEFNGILDNGIKNTISIQSKVVVNDEFKAMENTITLQEEIDYLNTIGGGILYLPSGIIYSKMFNVESNVSLIGMGIDRTIIQLILPNERYYRAIGLHGNNTLAHLTIKDDKTNDQQPSTTDTVHKDNVQALLLATGSNIVLESCSFYNSSTWFFGCDESALIERRNNIKILNCYNEWEKRDYYEAPFDVSQVYVSCESMEFRNNTFKTKSPDFSRTVFDIKGIDIVIEDNYIEGYIQPLLLQNSYVNIPNNERDQNHVVRNNTFVGAKIGTMLYSYKKGFNDVILNKHYKNLIYENNYVSIDTRLHTQQSTGQLISGFTFSPSEQGTFENINISNNTFEYISIDECKTNELLISGIGLYNSQKYFLSDVTIENNSIKNFPYAGIVVGYSSSINSDALSKNIKITKNDFLNNGAYKLKKNWKSYINSNIIILDNLIEDLYIKDNIFSFNNKEKHAVYTISHTKYNNDTVRNIYMKNNIDVSNEMGTSITRECNYLAGKDTGLPKVFDIKNRFNPEYELSVNCRDITIEKVSYYNGDTIITNSGMYKATGSGTTGIDPGCIITSIHGTNSFIVNDTSNLDVGDFIEINPGITTRIAGIVGNIVYIEYGEMVTSYVGYQIKYVRALTKI